MNRRSMGFAFIAIAAFLYTARFIAAAIYMSNMTSHGGDWFQSGMSYVGQGLHLWALTALVIGVVYLVLSERSDYKQLKKSQ